VNFALAEPEKKLRVDSARTARDFGTVVVDRWIGCGQGASLGRPAVNDQVAPALRIAEQWAM
jgi:hypothetical protein